MTSYEAIKKRLIEIYSPTSGNNISFVCFECAERFLKYLPVEEVSNIAPDREGGIGMFYFYPYESYYVWVSIGNDGYGCIISSKEKSKVKEVDFTTEDISVIASIVKEWIWG
jgi:hypothetical protein